MNTIARIPGRQAAAGPAHPLLAWLSRTGHALGALKSGHTKLRMRSPSRSRAGDLSIQVLPWPLRGTCAIRLRGALVADSVPVLLARLGPLLHAGDVLRLDLRGVSDINSAGVASLVVLARRCIQAAGDFLALNVPPHIRERIELHGAGLAAMLELGRAAWPRLLETVSSAKP